jgi:hypothetical protein
MGRRRRSGGEPGFAAGIVLIVVLGAAHDELAAEKLLVVEFLDGAPRFFGRLHLDERETLGTLRLFMADDFGRHDLADAVEQLREVALGRVEREIADVKTRRGHLDGFGLARTAAFATLAAFASFTGGRPSAYWKRIVPVLA